MNKNENLRTLVIFLAFLVLTTLICVANIIKLNIFALVVDMVMVVSICFILGYNYCLYDSEKSAKKADENIFPTNIPVIKDEEVDKL